MKKHLERITVLNKFVDQCNWEGVNYPSVTKDWKKVNQITKKLLLMCCLLNIIKKTLDKLTLNVEYPKHLQEQQNDLPFCPEGLKINKFQKLISNLYDKKICHVHKSPTKTSITSKKHLKWTTALKRLWINFNWEGINYPSVAKRLKKFESNNQEIDFNMFVDT